ncbi:MAG: diguanylate cyclase [Woeseiaceae bacterium]|nr:diguanylate cyclase [Woeseiaceae bacterium]
MNLDVALSILLLCSAVCYLLLGLRLIRSRREGGTMPMGVLFAVISGWVVGSAIELAATNFLVFSIGRTLHFVGTALLPVAAWVTFREYTGTETRTRHLVMLMILPVVSVTLAATNSSHEFMWLMPAANDAGEFLTRPEKWGLWFLFVHAPYSYAVIGAAILTLLLHSSRVAPAHRRGLFLLVAACVLPLIATLAYDLGLGPVTISWVPIVFTIMLPMYAWLILGGRIVEYTPLAYETVFQNMQDPVVVVDEQCRVIGLNHGAEAMLGVTEASALREPLASLFRDDSPEVFEALSSGSPQKMLTATGRFLHVQASPIATSARGGRVLMFRDVSDVEKAQIEVRRSEQLLRTLINHSVNGILRMRWVSDEVATARQLHCIFANRAAGRFLNVDSDELVNVPFERLLALVVRDLDPRDADGLRLELRDAIDSGASVDTEYRQRASGEQRWLRLICEPVNDDIAMTIVDITDEKAKERQMESIALSDPLTGVLNRRGFEQAATRRLSRSADDATGALLFVDLNDFKHINDRYGHTTGDEVLRIAASRLRQSLRARDIVGRPGGDEFVALVPDVTPEIADKLAQRLADALEAPYTVEEHVFDCAASIGLALYPRNANTLTGLLREADQAMYRAKARCRGVTDIRSRDLLERAV